MQQAITLAAFKVFNFWGGLEFVCDTYAQV